MLARAIRTGLGQAAVLVAVCVLVYWIWLGGRPFDFSEGHRVIPGWNMLESGDWLHMRMFETTYMRKPPGMPWAIAASSVLLGMNEFAARAPSAACITAMTLIAWGFSRRWFGSGSWAFAAGLAQALMPLMWSPGRTAEIEMLNNLGTQVMALGVVDVLWKRWFDEPGARAGVRHRALGIACIALGLVIAILAKGPAGLPVGAGVILGACILARSVRSAFRWRIWAGVFLAAAVIVPLGVVVLNANHDPLAVREEIGEHFLWSSERITGVLTLAPMAFVSALPASLALLFVFGRSARMEAARDTRTRDAFVAARLCAVGWLCSLVVLVLAGVSNPRYAMPAASLLPPIVGYVVMGCVGGRESRVFGTRRAMLARGAIIGRPELWAPLLLAASVGMVLFTTIIRRGDADAGTVAARAFAAALPADATVWADDAIEARPDVLLYVRRFKDGRLRPVWVKQVMARGELPTPASFLLLRMDAGSGEGGRYADAISRGRLSRVATMNVRTYEFSIFRVLD